MHHLTLALAGFATVVGLGAASLRHQQEPSMKVATGTFDVTTTPQPSDRPDSSQSAIARLLLDKQFRGDLDATSQGTMLAIGDGRTSGAYVALEIVTGTLDGRKGSFALMHRSGMRNGAPENWSILVVPGSGTGELSGIDGELTIMMADGKHGYELRYQLEDGQTD